MESERRTRTTLSPTSAAGEVTSLRHGSRIAGQQVVRPQMTKQVAAEESHLSLDGQLMRIQGRGSLAAGVRGLGDRGRELRVARRCTEHVTA